MTKLIVGLGNPGEKYRNNRHNVGHMVVEQLVTSDKAQVTRSPFPKLVTCYMLPVTQALLAKPLTFMNDSGQAVSKLKNFYKVSLNDLYVVHDELDIPLGQYKIQFGRGPKVHKGVESVDQALGSREYWRVRVGVDNRDVENRTPGEQYVLQDFTEEEKKVVEEVIKKVAQELITSIT